jgi:hypothetical protein
MKGYIKFNIFRRSPLMKKAFLAFCCAGFAFVAQAGHPFNTLGSVLVGDGEVEVIGSAGTDFLGDGDGGIDVGITYGIGERFNIGLENGWAVNKKDTDDRGFGTPGLFMQFSLIPDVLSIAGSSALNGSEFGSAVVYTLALESETELNFNAGFEGDGAGYSAFSYSFSAIQSIESLFFGAEIYGSAYKDTEERPYWQIGVGYGFENSLIVSLGFGGSFKTKDDLAITLGCTFVFGGGE